MAHRRLISLAFLLVAPALGCDDDVDPFDGYQVVNSEAAPVLVVVATDAGQGPSTEPTVSDLKGPSDTDIVAHMTVSPVVVPVEYTAWTAPVDERVSVVIDVEADYVALIDRADIQIAVGSGETIESIELERDALTPDRFFVFLKPSCSSELRDDDGVCQLESIESCDVKVDGLAPVQGRCDAFSARLWQVTDEASSDDSTEESSGFARSSSARWVRADDLTEAPTR